MGELQIDSEFQALIPPLSDEERGTLESNLKAEGCRDPIVTWQGVILDGHNRYEICTRLEIAFQTVEVDLPDRESALDWMDANQLGRRNLTPEQMSLLRGRIYNRSKKERGGDYGNQHTVANGQNVQKPDSSPTHEDLGDRFGVSGKTVQRDGKFAESVESLKEHVPDIEQQVMAGEHKRQDVVEAAKDPENAQEALFQNHRAKGTGENEWYTPSEYIEAARRVLGTIDLDPASSEQANEVVGAEQIFTKEDNGAAQQWCGLEWINPRACDCGVEPRAVEWADEENTVSSVRRNNERYGKAVPDLHEIESAAAAEKMHAVLARAAKHARGFFGENREGQVVFRVLQRLHAGECEVQAGEAKEQPLRKGSGSGGKASIQQERQGQRGETREIARGQQHQENAQDAAVLSLESEPLGKVSTGVGLQLRVLWEGGENDAGSLCAAFASGMLRDSSGKHGSCMLEVQSVKGVDAPEGLAWRASVCPDCGKVGVSVKRPFSAFVNPPYSQPAIHQFAEAVEREWESGNLQQAIVLTHNYTDTRWFHILANACDAICFTKGRIGFVNADGEKAAPTQGQAFFYFGNNAVTFGDEFCRFGFVVNVLTGQQLREAA